MTKKSNLFENINDKFYDNTTEPSEYLDIVEALKAKGPSPEWVMKTLTPEEYNAIKKGIELYKAGKGKETPRGWAPFDQHPAFMYIKNSDSPCWKNIDDFIVDKNSVDAVYTDLEPGDEYWHLESY
jgi:hypothetical protein